MLYMYLFLLLPVITALIHTGVAKRPFPRGRTFEIWLTHVFFWAVGIAGIIAYIVNSYDFIADWTANWIRFEKGTAWQELVGISYLAIGVLGILCVVFRGGFWIATTIGSIVFALGHAWVFFFNDIPTRIMIYSLVYDVIGSGVLLALVAGYYMSGGPEVFWDCRGTCALKAKPRKSKRR